MLGPILGWYARKLYDKYKKSKEPPAPEPEEVQEGVTPYVAFEGRVTMNQLSAPALTGEWKMGEFDPETGLAELTPPEEKLTAEPTRLTTFIDDEEGAQQITVRWEKGRGKLKLAKARKDEIWRVEFYKVADVKEELVPTVAGGALGEQSPFGGDPGGGVS